MSTEYNIKEEFERLKENVITLKEKVSKFSYINEYIKENNESHKLLWEHIHNIEKDFSDMKITVSLNAKALIDLENVINDLNKNLINLTEVINMQKPLLEYVQDLKKSTRYVLNVIITSLILSLTGWLLYLYRKLGGN